MKLLHWLFTGGHFVISLLFLVAGAALIAFAGMQLWQSVQPFETVPLLSRLNAVLESIALLTVAVAALELGQTILEEEVHRGAQMSAPTRVRRFLSRFMVVIIVALAIEGLVATVKAVHEDLVELLYAGALIVATAALLAGWGLFIRHNRAAEELEPEAMAAAKREDRKLE